MGKITRAKNQYLEVQQLKAVEHLKTMTKKAQELKNKNQEEEKAKIYQAIYPYSEYFINNPKRWTNKHKTDNVHKLGLSLIKYVFQKYKLPAHFDQVWIEKINNPQRFNYGFTNTKRDRIDYRKWYICATQGGSLYKEYGRDCGLSKSDIHHFLTCPYTDLTTDQIVWYSIAKSRGASESLALRIARSRMSDFNYCEDFWRNVLQWFVNINIESRTQMSDLLDFIRYRHENEPQFSLKGRTLESLNKQMIDWHYELRRMKNIGGGSWEGMPVADSDITVGTDEETQVWHFRQITTGNALAQEGNKMHHCVSSYKSYCMRGTDAIWAVSMTRLNKTKDYLTIQVRIVGRNYSVIQVRGFANRSPNNHESAMVAMWAKKEGLNYDPRYNGW